MKPIDVALERLEAIGSNPRQNGSGWTARCPAHEDRNPSLSITETDEQSVLLHCHALCATDAVLKSLGLELRDLYPGPKDQRGDDDVVAVYRYHDETGTVSFEVVRKRGKRFLQRRPDGRGGWTWNIRGTRRVLYRLPQLIQAIKNKELVFIVEGERDADSITALGYVATTNPGGAGKWRDEYAHYFKGANVVVVADRDQPGYAHAAQVAASLRDIASSVKVVAAKEGKDASDHLTHGHQLEDLVGVAAPVPTEAPSPRGPQQPVLDSAALYGLAGEITLAVDPYTEADQAAVLATLLSGFGAMVGPEPHVRAGDAVHPARLNVVITGDTAKARKGSSRAATERILDKAAPEFAERILGGFGSGEAVIDAVRDEDDDPGRVRLLWIIESEFGALLKIATREGSILSHVIRNAFDGIKLQARSRRGTSVATHHHIAVLGHVTRDELVRNLTDVEVASGFGNRLQFIWVRRSKRLPFDSNVPDDVVAHFADRLRAALDSANHIGRMEFAAAARPRWAELYDEMADDEPMGLFGAIVARPEAQVLRLAVTYALLDASRQIDLPHLEAAWSFWCYSRASAALIFGDALGDPIADQLLTSIRAAGTTGLTLSDQHGLFGRNLRADRLNAARRVLLDRHLIVETTEDTDGRPATRHVASNLVTKETKDTNEGPR